MPEWRTVLAWSLPVLVGACTIGRDIPVPAAQYLVGAESALQTGDVELAQRLITRARERFPTDGATRLWAAELAILRWHEDEALRHLLLMRASGNTGGLTQAQLEGRIGDLYFRLGRYRESEAHLAVGQEAEQTAARRAYYEVARLLPFERHNLDIEVTELPLVGGALPQLLCSVRGEQIPFVLDTRATLTTLTRGLAESLGLTPILPSGTAIDGTGVSVPSFVTVLPELTLGNVDVGPLPVLVLEDRALALRDQMGGADQTPRALIGLDVLRRFRTTFDPARASVILQPKLGLEESASLPCLMAGQDLMIEIGIEGRRLWFALDTGASASSLSEAGLAQLPDGDRRALETFGRVYSPGGARYSVRKVQGLVLDVGTVRFRGVDLQVVDRDAGGVLPVHGVLGADLLLQCRTTLDSGRIRFEPR